MYQLHQDNPDEQDGPAQSTLCRLFCGPGPRGCTSPAGIPPHHVAFFAFLRQLSGGQSRLKCRHPGVLWRILDVVHPTPPPRSGSSARLRVCSSRPGSDFPHPADGDPERQRHHPAKQRPAKHRPDPAQRSPTTVRRQLGLEEQPLFASHSCSHHRRHPQLPSQPSCRGSRAEVLRPAL